ncbi:hypothetical protein BC941DRAFT_87118 [Chlamydoabsidia padenii]|nr:hypothetical protein BC941DRAFT_87118 [Chlamydoabsidia padenii]
MARISTLQTLLHSFKKQNNQISPFNRRAIILFLREKVVMSMGVLHLLFIFFSLKLVGSDDVDNILTRGPCPANQMIIIIPYPHLVYLVIQVQYKCTSMLYMFIK